MAVIFSAVTLTSAANDEQLGFLVGGIPREFEDLKGWSFFDNYLRALDEDMDINVHADVYLYGEGESFNATPSEVAYMYKRIEDNPNFLNDRCQIIDKVDFSFYW